MMHPTDQMSEGYDHPVRRVTSGDLYCLVLIMEVRSLTEVEPGLELELELELEEDDDDDDEDDFFDICTAPPKSINLTW